MEEAPTTPEELVVSIMFDPMPERVREPVRLALVPKRLVNVPVVENREVEVADVVVEFVANRLVNDPRVENRLVVVAEVVVE